MENEQNNPANTSIPLVLPEKRKRGRPRKEVNAAKMGEGNLQLPATPDGIRALKQIDTKPNDRSMVGKVVSGVIDGSFDAGYFLSVRIGNNGPPLRGVIFEPGRIVPISSDNDVAPRAKLYERTELPMLDPVPQNQSNGVVPELDMQQPVLCGRILPSEPQSSASFEFHNLPASTTAHVVSMAVNNSCSSLVDKMLRQQDSNFNDQNQSQFIPPAEKLRMVEQNDMMQVYEVSVQSEGQIADAGSAKDWMSESSIKPNANNVLPCKEITDQVAQYHNLDVGFWPEPSTPVHNGNTFSGIENLVVIEPQSVVQETQPMDSEVKQNQLASNELKEGCLDFHQPSVIAQGQPLPGEPQVKDSVFQPMQLVQDESQVRNFELHETPIVVQTPAFTLANQNTESELQRTESTNSQINCPNPRPQFLLQDHQALDSENKSCDPIENQPTRPDHELYRAPELVKLQSISSNPENREAELEPSKLAHYDLENQNFGILRDFVAGNHHYLPPEIISDQPVEFMEEKPNSPKSNNRKISQLEPKASVLENNESSPSGKLISHPIKSNQQNSKTREPMSFDLELASEDPPLRGIPENIVSSSTSNPGGLSNTEPR
ncbi:hypothetical protein ACH5RR_018215 [Cinchona calisaya]|uniref:AT hook motif-containing protein n=1 Tax=Cinchona calisaya TaxID=153742 RepID=A0ABD2ZKY2_9GENT